MGRSEQDGQDAGVVGGHDGRTVRVCRIEHRQRVVDPLLERGRIRRCDRIRTTDASSVAANQSRERRQPPDRVCEVALLLPRVGGNEVGFQQEKVLRGIPQHLVREVDVAVSGIERPSTRRHLTKGSEATAASLIPSTRIALRPGQRQGCGTATRGFVAQHLLLRTCALLARQRGRRSRQRGVANLIGILLLVIGLSIVHVLGVWLARRYPQPLLV